MKCKKCGTELRSDDEFCYRCGQRTTVLQRLFASKAVIGSGVAILVVIIASILTWMIMSGRLDIRSLKSKINNNQNQSPMVADENPAGNSSEDESEDSAATEETAAPTQKPTPTPYVFKPGDVTQTAKVEMKNLTKQIKPFLAFSASFYENGSHPFKWDNVSATTMAMYGLYFKDKTIKYGTPMAAVEKKTKKEMKNLFGNNSKYNFTYGGYFPDYVFVKTGDTIVYNAVQITGKAYQMDVNKILEYKEGRYRLIVSAYLVSNTDKSKGYAQKYTLFVDKDSSSKYGFVIKKMKLYAKKDAKI